MIKRLRDLLVDGVLLVALVLLGALACSAFGRRSAETLENFVLIKIPGYLITKSIAADFGRSEHQADLLPAQVSFDDNAARANA